jgi:hypothetical protein
MIPPVKDPLTAVPTSTNVVLPIVLKRPVAVQVAEPVD